MSFTVLDPTDSAWATVLSSVPHDVYHLPGYAHVAAWQEHRVVRLAVVSEGEAVLAMPFLLREIPSELARCVTALDASVPYGYPGPVCSVDELETQAALVVRLLEGLREMGAVSLFVRCHPFVGVRLEALERQGLVLVHGDQVYLDLPALPPDIESSFRCGHRYNIVLARRAGFSLRCDIPGDYHFFPELYRHNMRRIGASDYYLFDDGYFAKTCDYLRENLHLVTVLGPEGDIAAQLMLFVCGEFGQYHLAATADRHLKAAPQKLGILGMAQLARDVGVKKLNLGGGVGGCEDSLFDFKAGFSGKRARFATARFVLDPVLYEQLSRGASPSNDFFPAYRHGL